MLTRKMTNSSTQPQRKSQNKGKTKLSTNPISKKQIRKIIKKKLKINSSIKAKQANGLVLKRGDMERQEMLSLIDQSKCECPICLQIAITPIILPCGHCYCLKCFEENSIFNLRCCMCRLDVSTQDILSAKMVQTLIENYIVPNSSEEISYWCRKGEFSEWEGRRRIDLQTLRPGDNIDIRTEDNSWRRGVIVHFLFRESEYSIEVKFCLNAQIENIFLPASSRRLAPSGFFTKGQYLKYRTVNYESKFVESIEIPQIKCEFIDDSRQLSFHGSKSASQNKDQEYEDEGNHDLALELFQYEMKQWENVFQLN